MREVARLLLSALLLSSASTLAQDTDAAKRGGCAP
jgi:hypothetical protein